MRDFVRNILPQIQSRSPQMLDLSAEVGMEHEIDNANATVVRGDGVETGAVKEDLEEQERTESEPEENAPPRNKEFPSWSRSRARAESWLPRSSAVEHSSLPTPSDSSPDAPSRSSGLRRIQSAISVILQDNSPPHRGHRRTLSHHPRDDSAWFQTKRAGPGQISLPTVSMSSAQAPLPSPSIRRSSNASHPDITSLVEQWTLSGPANHTLVFKSHS